MLINGLNFQRTCYACPEQYDIFMPETREQVGYVRLRWGNLTCEAPDAGGELIYSTYIGDGLTGIFENNEQRRSCLSDIADRILNWDKISEV